MKLTITSTDQITEIDGIQVRHWRGVGDGGQKCDVFVHRIAVHKHGPLVGLLDTQLREMGQPGGSKHVPIERILP